MSMISLMMRMGWEVMEERASLQMTKNTRVSPYTRGKAEIRICRTAFGGKRN